MGKKRRRFHVGIVHVAAFLVGVPLLLSIIGIFFGPQPELFKGIVVFLAVGVVFYLIHLEDRDRMNYGELSTEEASSHERRDRLWAKFLFRSWLLFCSAVFLFGLYTWSFLTCIVAIAFAIPAILLYLFIKRDNEIYNILLKIDDFWKTKRGRFVLNWVVGPFLLVICLVGFLARYGDTPFFNPK